MRSEKSVSGLILKGLFTVLGIFVDESGGDNAKIDKAFALSGRNNTNNFRPGRCPELIAFGPLGRLKCVQSNSKEAGLSDMPFLSKRYALSLEATCLFSTKEKVCCFPLIAPC